MKITQVETTRVASQPNLMFVEIGTDAGEVGLGESFLSAPAVESYIHDTVAPILLGSSLTAPEAAAHAIRNYVGYQGSGVETRGNAAIDLALWDLLGKQSGQPLVRLLGGPVFSSIPIYNTCAGPSYIADSSRQWSGNWGIGANTAQNAFEDLHAFLNHPARLAAELLASGYTAMKIWPFDKAAERSLGNEINRDELHTGLRIVEEIRDAVGDEMRIMIEMHGLWLTTPAKTIAAALTDLDPYWIEDPVRPDSIDGLTSLAASTSLRIATGETVAGRRGFLSLLQNHVVDVATLDVQWCGGVTEARKIAALADTFGIPIAPHDCTGPVTLAASAHVVMSQPNGLIQETARAFMNTWYADIAEGLPRIDRGTMFLNDTPGHGVALRDGLRDLPGTTVRSSPAPRSDTRSESSSVTANRRG